MYIRNRKNIVTITAVVLAAMFIAADMVDASRRREPDNKPIVIWVTLQNDLHAPVKFWATLSDSAPSARTCSDARTIRTEKVQVKPGSTHTIRFDNRYRPSRCYNDRACAVFEVEGKKWVEPPNRSGFFFRDRKQLIFKRERLYGLYHYKASDLFKN